MTHSPIPCLSNEKELQRAVMELADTFPLFKQIVTAYGNPPLWKREEGFQTLIHIILEQQVSLASAKAAFDRLLEASGGLTPERFVHFSDQELKTIGFSRQKSKYGRELSEAIISGSLDLTMLSVRSDDEVRQKLTAVKGIGIWTANIYLLMAMGRKDVWPTGDIALSTSYTTLKGLKKRPDNEDMKEVAKQWQPNRSVAARLLWHNYLSEKQK